MSPSEAKPANPNAPRFLRGLMWVLFAWGLLVALGAFLGPQYWETRRESAEPAAEKTSAEAGESALTRRFDARKPAIVVLCVGGFVGGWVLLLVLRQRRLSRQVIEQSNEVQK